MAHILIKKLYTEMPSANLSDVTVNGWVRTMRESKAFAFVELNDGSYFRNLQVVLEADKLPNYRELTRQITLGAAVEFTGTLVLTPDMKQPFELKAESVTVVGESPVRLSPAEEAPHAGIPAHHSAPAPPGEPVPVRVPRALRRPRRPSIASSTTRAISTSTRPSSPAVTARARARCSA